NALTRSSGPRPPTRSSRKPSVQRLRTQTTSWERVRALSIAAVVAALISGLLGWRSRPQQDTPAPPAPRRALSPSAASSGHAVAGLADVWPHAPADLAGV